MRLDVQLLLAAVAGLFIVDCPSSAADDRTDGDDHRHEHEDVPLSQDDLRDITAQVMARQPLLASSPGIKVADADRVWDEEFAFVVYHPHSDEAGIKQAFQVECARKPPVKTWNCEDPSIRRYLALATQDYEVRVTGPIGYTAAMALIEASRQVLPLVTDTGIGVPDTVRNISSFDDGASVVWVSSKGESAILIKGQLTEGSDPAQPGHWILSRFDRQLLGIE